MSTSVSDPPYGWSPWQRLLSALLLGYTAMCVFVPFTPHWPGADLDESWILGINQAVALGLSFGPEVLFPAGPFSAVYTLAYHPATWGNTLGVSAVLALAMAVALYWLVQHSWWRLGLALAALVVAGVPLRDVPMFAYPVVLALLCWHRRDLSLPLLALLFAPLALLPLIKGTLLLLCGLITALCVLLLLCQRRWSHAAVVGAAPLLSLPLVWWAAGQPLVALPLYFAGMAQIVAGYSEAMALNGKHFDVLSYLLCATALLALLLQRRALPLSGRLFLGAVFFLVLFVSFKGGFVRHDPHAIIAAGSLGVAALLLGMVLPSWPWALCTLAALVLGVHIVGRYLTQPATYLYVQTQSLFAAPWRTWQQMQSGAPSYAQRFDAAMRELKVQGGLPPMDGSVDIYSHGQSQLIASGNRWNPRPVLQSYSAYTPALVEMNRQHLLGPRAPAHVVFTPQAIDGRYPTLEDGASWPVLLHHYQPIKLLGDQLWLSRKAQRGPLPPSPQGEYSTHLFGQSVEVPLSSAAMWVEIDVQPSLPGRFANTLFKTSKLIINARLADGSQRQHRLVSGMARPGFLLSPLVQNSLEFLLLYGPGDANASTSAQTSTPPSALAKRRVLSFAVGTSSAFEWLWQTSYRVRFTPLPLPDPMALGALGSVWALDALQPDSRQAVAASCQGSIDGIDGVYPLPASATASGLFAANGWLGAPAENPQPVARPYVVLTREDGARWLMHTRLQKRTDLPMHFGRAEMAQSGYTARVDLSGLSGRFLIGLGYEREGQLMLCPQFSTSLTIVDTSHAQR